MTFLDNLFGSQYDLLRRNLQGQTNQAAGDAMRVTNAGAARGATSPMALASASARASQQQRGAVAGQNAAMLQQAQAADQQRGFQLLGTGISAGSSLLGMLYPGAGQIGGMAGNFVQGIGADQATKGFGPPVAQPQTFTMPANPASLLGNPRMGQAAPQVAPQPTVQAPAPQQMVTPPAPAPQAAPILPPPTTPSSASIMSQVPTGGPAPAPGSMAERTGLSSAPQLSPELLQLILSGMLGGFRG